MTLLCGVGDGARKGGKAKGDPKGKGKGKKKLHTKMPHGKPICIKHGGGTCDRADCCLCEQVADMFETSVQTSSQTDGGSVIAGE